MSALTDPIADFLTRLRNASRAQKTVIELPYSRMKGDFAEVLKREGFIVDCHVESLGIRKTLKVELKYVDRTPALSNLRRVSRPGLRRYVGASEIPRVRGGNGIALLSTPRGILSGREAKRQNVGGELLAFVY